MAKTTQKFPANRVLTEQERDIGVAIVHSLLKQNPNDKEVCMIGGDNTLVIGFWQNGKMNILDTVPVRTQIIDMDEPAAKVNLDIENAQ